MHVRFIWVFAQELSQDNANATDKNREPEANKTRILHRLVRNNRLSIYKIGGVVIFIWSLIDKFVSRRPVDSGYRARKHFCRFRMTNEHYQLWLEWARGDRNWCEAMAPCCFRQRVPFPLNCVGGRLWVRCLGSGCVQSTATASGGSMVLWGWIHYNVNQ